MGPEDKSGGATRSHAAHGLVGHGEECAFYPKNHGKWWNPLCLFLRLWGEGTGEKES